MPSSRLISFTDLPRARPTSASRSAVMICSGGARIKGCVKREDIAGPQGASSRPMWETLEGMVREKAQEFIQQIMEEEVTELLGREKSERRSTVDSAEGYRNGYGKPRRQKFWMFM